MATTNVEVEFVFISKDELRRIIAEEVRKAVEPGAIRPPYLPTPPAPEWWQSPVISCGTTCTGFGADDQIVVN